MSLAWDPFAENKEKEKSQREFQMKKVESKRKVYLERALKNARNNTNTRDETRLNQLERAVFILGRPLEQWDDLGFNPQELWDALKIFLFDGGIKYYTALLLTDPNRGDVKASSQALRQDHIDEHARCYSIESSSYKRYVNERVFEPLFLFMLRVKTKELYLDYVNTLHKLVEPDDLVEYPPGTTLWTAPRERGPVNQTEEATAKITAQKRAREPEVYADVPSTIPPTPQPSLKKSSAMNFSKFFGGRQSPGESDEEVGDSLRE